MWPGKSKMQETGARQASIPRQRLENLSVLFVFRRNCFFALQPLPAHSRGSFMVFKYDLQVACVCVFTLALLRKC